MFLRPTRILLPRQVGPPSPARIAISYKSARGTCAPARPAARAIGLVDVAVVAFQRGSAGTMGRARVDSARDAALAGACIPRVSSQPSPRFQPFQPSQPSLVPAAVVVVVLPQKQTRFPQKQCRIHRLSSLSMPFFARPAIASTFHAFLFFLFLHWSNVQRPPLLLLPQPFGALPLHTGPL